jgi:hypothetical protein
VTTSVDAQYDARGDEEVSARFHQVDYSIGNRGAADQILPLARDKGMRC